MPRIGIIRGFGESYNATGYIEKLIKMLNKRFRSHIVIEEIPCGDYLEHGPLLSEDCLSMLRECDCIFIGDFKSNANPVEFTINDIAVALTANTEYTHISGFGSFSDIDVCIASYFDGGYSLREGERTDAGCSETRVCSTFAAKNIVKDVSRLCEARRRRLAFVKDEDNAFCADMFYRMFESFVLPLSNFKIVKYLPRELCRDILADAAGFDIIFSSSAFAETIMGAFEFIMEDRFCYYKRYNGEKTIYALDALGSNSDSGDYTPSLYSYIIALCAMLKNEFDMEKEAMQLHRAMEYAINAGASSENGEEFIAEVIKGLQKVVPTKHSKVTTVSKYIK